MLIDKNEIYDIKVYIIISKKEFDVCIFTKYKKFLKRK